MVKSDLFIAFATLCHVAQAGCPYMDNDARDLPASHPAVRRDESTGAPPASTDEFLAKYEIKDTDVYLTNNFGGQIEDQESLSAGERGPTLLEDFTFREKITHFDHERVPERAVHARGAGAHGVFTSYGDWANITGASFLKAPGKETPVFIRFSTVAGSRGSADTVRDVHGFAVRFYTDEGNFDVVGNNVPVFFIQDAIKFPDLIHAVKPRPDNEIPQAATGHDSAWDFFSQQPSSLHTLFWAMSGHGTIRSYRHTDGWGVHTFRFVTDEGKTKLVKFRFRTQQGKASLLWEEAQITAGKNADAHRQDLFESIEKGYFPEWVFEAQIMEEEDQLRFGFDLLDPTKIVPEDIVPFTPLGKLTLNRNPRNYFAETEQIMYQVGHVVRGIDLTEDPLLQGRLFSYLDTQLNRHNGPNFEQLPINQPRVPVHTNTRDGAGQMYIPLNVAAYSPNTLNGGSPRQANQTHGRGFFTAPNRSVGGRFTRAVSSTFADVWSQPRLFFNSLLPVEQQFLINAIRFEVAQLTSDVVKNNVLIQLNRVSHDVAVRVAEAINLKAPDADAKYYHSNTTTGVSASGEPLLKIDGLKVGYLTSSSVSGDRAAALKSALGDLNVGLVVVAERLGRGIDQIYQATFAGQFDAVVVDGSANALFAPAGSLAHSNATSPGNRTGSAHSTLYPAGRPLQILQDGYQWGKPVAVVGEGSKAFEAAGIEAGTPGVFEFGNSSDASSIVKQLSKGLYTYKFLDRYPLDQ
ncbi:catalase-domain-containing protein [Cucurbitaria berberidis CBS 394.84]|uniref:Catalase n=1 Tax=Cucurbitaria berberidis CBS 394.84 TaxID=1168544 RepID=A0A9P4LAZ9_9PLEO|nr:catalase-domain-containing protein [Cucurbitaria berberidis CBS 394.84]KAF1848540.1 catalase-domain-containing protein [Cucurbitaria berberidis CBS 394.84]